MACRWSWRPLGVSSFPPRRNVHSQPLAYPVEGVRFGGEFALRLNQASEAGDMSRKAQRRILDDFVAYHPSYMEAVNQRSQYLATSCHHYIAET